MSKLKLFFAGYISVVFGLFLYSYTQVDLNLTLSQVNIWQMIQKKFQYIGWFERPISALIFLILLLLLTFFYLLLLRLVKENKLSRKQFWVIVGFSSFILLFSYNAFSYDLFNYMFDARILTYHHNNPYFQKALDYPSDPWINFMRWTHRTYPYGPVWLGLTIPISFLGFQFFLPTLFLFKGFMVAGYLGSIFFIGKISEKISSKNPLLNMAFFAFNPLIIIESLVSGHNDIVMIVFSLAAIFLFLDKRYLRSFLLLLLSGGIKFATFLILPLFIIFAIFEKKRIKLNMEFFFLAIVFLMVVSVVFASVRTELQPWYLLWIIPFVSLINKSWLRLVSIIFSLMLLLHYVPFLYIGNWNSPIPTIKYWLTFSALFVSCLIILLSFARVKSKIK